jgi:hypothetical protein
MLTAKQRRAVELHAKRLRKQAEDADRQYAQLRAAFPTYASNDGGLLMVAARHSDDARRAAANFADGLSRIR